MAPASWVAALLFVLFVAPGLVFDMLSERRRAGASESTFREISRVVLASIFCSGTTLLILATVRALVAPWWLPDPGRLIRDGIRYGQENYPILAWTLAGGVAFSVLLAVGAHYFLARGGGASIEQRSTWTHAFKLKRPPDRMTIARVRLNDGTIYSGQVEAFSVGLELEDREIVLSTPHLKVKPVGGDLRALPDHYERVVLTGANIQSIVVSYWPKLAPPQPDPTPVPPAV